MKKEFAGQSSKGGVYQIRNLQNGKVYIGSAKCFQKRAAQHESRLNSGKHSNKHLLASWNKHGSNNFLFEILEVVEGDKLQRTKREQFYINQYLDKWEQCYNFQKKSVCKLGSWSNTPEVTKRKMSIAIKAVWKNKAEEEITEWKNKISKSLLGHKVSQKTKLKISKSLLGSKQSDETKKKRSKMMKARGPNWYAISEENKERLASLRKGKIAWNKGRKCSEQEKEKMSKVFYEKCLTNEWRDKQRKARLGKKDSAKTIETKRLASKTRKPIVAINVATNEEKLFPSLRNASITLGINDANIYAVLSGKRTVTKGYKFYRPQ